MTYSQSEDLLKWIDTSRARGGVLAMGLGTAGCRITSALQDNVRSITHFMYASTEAHDIPSEKEGVKILLESPGPSQRSPQHIRTLAQPYLPEIRAMLRRCSASLIASGLGGSVGTGLAPMLAEEVREAGVPCVCIAAMPFRFEKSKHFRAGCALRASPQDGRWSDHN